MNHHVHPVPGSDVQMHLLTAPESIIPGKETPLSFKPIRHTASGKPVPLVQHHEAAFHLIVLDASLTWFRHLHPELQADGSYRITITFPGGDNYLLYADYQPEGGPAVADRIPLTVAGNSPRAAAATGEKLTATTANLNIEIDLTAPLHTGAAAELPFRIGREGKLLRATELLPYLGAVAHLILIHQDDKDFLHIHPQAGTDVPVVAHTQFQKAGLYRMWIQFNINGTVYTADFTLDVKEAPHSNLPQQHQAHHHG